MKQKVKFPCEHGRWFRHPVDAKAPKWDWCDGGETKWLKRPERIGEMIGVYEGPTLWVEVTDVE